MFARALLVLLLVIVAPASAHAATWYVSPSGSGTACTSGTPCGSFSAAYAAASPGDVVEVAAGSYGFQSTPEGTRSGPPVVFRESGGDVEVSALDAGGDWTTFQGFEITTGGVGVVSTIANNKAIGNRFEDVRMVGGLYLQNTDQTAIIGGEICCRADTKVINMAGQIGGDPANTANTDVLIDGTDIHTATRTSGSVHTECAFLIAVQGMTIRNTHWWNCAVYNFGIGKIGSDLCPSDILIENSVFEASDDITVGGKQGYYAGYVQSCGVDVQFRNNAFEQGLELDPTASPEPLVTGNLLYQGFNCNDATFVHNTMVRGGGACSGGDDHDNVSIASLADQWIDPANDDYRLKPTSPAIDAADPSDAPALDKDGRVRDALPDAGPYEYEPAVAKWALNETSGTTAADSINGLDGTLTNGAAWTASGKYGGAATFDGTDDYVNVPDDTLLDLDTFTLEAWVYPTSLSGSQYRSVIFKEDGANSRQAYSLYASEGASHPTAEVGDPLSSGVERIIGSQTIAANTWTHIAATYDGTALKVFKNGVEIGAQALTGTLPTSSSPLRIGGNMIYWNEWFEGHIDEVAVYDRALSAAEIAADM
ncbi:LamG domain-containing protein [Solirubrobacter phytolaccae]|uniref:LamG domain-containing protein n=1 Tax=Solirubrobacter phytolaccae TaxID=1404360 RepID=A0A9X3S8N6_9ACTN|nr:LamG domain-containing protein [Solirubrobacter phytolaccae]MDA0182419.1 LamG domain-containing protein [Solirubrobacter phytolaccae]